MICHPNWHAALEVEEGADDIGELLNTTEGGARGAGRNFE